MFVESSLNTLLHSIPPNLLLTVPSQRSLSHNAGLITNFEVFKTLEMQRIRNRATKRATKDMHFVEKQVCWSGILRKPKHCFFSSSALPDRIFNLYFDR